MFHRAENVLDQPQPRRPPGLEVRHEVAVLGDAAPEGGRALAGRGKVALDAPNEFVMRDHGAHHNRTIPLSASGVFLDASRADKSYQAGMDPVRVLLAARLDQLRLNMAAVSKEIGKSHSYLQQFLRRGIPRVLPEDVREKLAPIVQVSPDALRGGVPAKGGPREVSAEAVAANEGEAELLRAFRRLTPAGQARALKVLPTLE